MPTSLLTAAELIAGARAYVGPDGCLHHVAAAVETPAVVIFGGFSPKECLGYTSHINLGEGAYGDRKETARSREAMEAIRPEQVVEALRSLL